MQVLLHEVKKIFTWKIFIVLLFVNWIIFFLFIEDDIKLFANGKNSSYHIGVEMVEKYGNSFDENDFLDFKQTYNAKVEEANHYLQTQKEFAEVGIITYQDFPNIDVENEEHQALLNKVLYEEKNAVFWELQERTRLIERYENKIRILENKKKYRDSKQQARYDELMAAEQFQVYPEVAKENFENFIFHIAMAIILSVVVVISPIFINDRSNRLLDLQYTMKKGRRLYSMKVAAGWIAASIVMTMLFIFYFSLYSLNQTSMFFKVPLHMFEGPNYWYDPTFFQYIVLTVIATYILGLMFALLAMVVSSIVSNYITLVGIQIPFLIAMFIYGIPYMTSYIISLRMNQWVIPISYSVMIISCLILIMFMWKREQKRDILL